MSTVTTHCHTKDLIIKHFDITVPVVTVGKAAYFPLKTLCLRMGIDPDWQISKVRRLAESGEDSKWAGALRMLPVWTAGGNQPAQCLHRRHLGRWFDSLDPSRVVITARGPLSRLQRELEAAADRFLLGDTGDVVTDEMDCPCCGVHLVKIDGEWSKSEEQE